MSMSPIRGYACHNSLLGLRFGRSIILLKQLSLYKIFIYLKEIIYNLNKY